LNRIAKRVFISTFFITISLFLEIVIVAYAAEEEKELPEGTRNLLLALILLYLLFFRQKQPVEAPPKGEVSVEAKGFEAPAIALFKTGEEVKVNKSYTIKNAWKITLSSYQLFEGGAIGFNFLVENIQDKVASCELKESTYLLDKEGNKYHKVHISKPGRREYIPNVPVEIKVSFFELKEDMKAFILYLNFEGNILLENRWEGKELFFGPIK
jgi:hypothetical protein